jgi:hypothetical protein
MIATPRRSCEPRRTARDYPVALERIAGSPWRCPRLWLRALTTSLMEAQRLGPILCRAHLHGGGSAGLIGFAHHARRGAWDQKGGLWGRTCGTEPYRLIYLE